MNDKKICIECRSDLKIEYDKNGNAVKAECPKCKVVKYQKEEV